MSKATEKQLLKARTYREGLDKASRERYDGKLIYLNVGRLFRWAQSVSGKKMIGISLFVFSFLLYLLQ